MMKILSRTMLILILGLLINACNKDNSTNPPVQNNTGYFPDGDGSSYTYSMSKTDSNGTQNTGTRRTEYTGVGSKKRHNLPGADRLHKHSRSTSVSLSYFRKTNDSLYYFLDTTGLSAAIPDSLKSNISIDNEMKMLSFPVDQNSSWKVFTLSIVYIFNIPVLNVDGAYDGTENITLHLNSGDVNKDAVKIKYTFSLNCTRRESTNYKAYAWLVDGIGIVKWQGNGAILMLLPEEVLIFQIQLR